MAKNSFCSFQGYVSSPTDAGILIHSSSQTPHLVKRIRRRLVAHERAQIKSGSVFVFNEQESGMKRWTDGMRWSKSRVEGQFLVYRRIEAEEPLPIELEPSKRRRLSSVDSVSASSTIGDDDTLNEDDRFVTEKLYQSNQKTQSIAKSGSKALNDSILCKKTFAISLEGSICHVVMIIKKICYYTKDDIMAGLLKSPTAMEIFKDVKLPASFLNPCNFRLHPKSNAPLKHQINTLQQLQSPVDQGEYRYEGNNADRFVTVNRLGDPQSLRISIGKDFKDFYRIIMHAFNFAPYDNIEIKVGTNTLISDQRSFSRIQSGSFVQVRKKDIVKQEHLISGFSAKHQPFRTKLGVKVLQLGSPQSRVTTERDYQAMSATNEAALALAALSSDSDPQKFWAFSEQSASGIM